MGRAQSGRTRLTIIVVVVLAVVGAGATWATADADGDDAAAGGPEPGLAWPADLAPIARRVEAIRGLDFRRVVPVRYSRLRTTGRDAIDLSDLDDERRAAIENAFRSYAVFGLVDPTPDVGALLGDLDGSLLGFYSFADHDIHVFVPEGSDQAELVVAHELTHALEAQHVPSYERRSPTSASEALALAAVVEGSASLVEHRYAADREAERTLVELPYPAASTGLYTTPADQELVADWEWFAALGAVPYVVGPEYVDAVVARRTFTWDTLSGSPPPSDKVLVDPLGGSGQRWTWTAVTATPDPAIAWEWAPTAVDVYLLLAGRVGAAAARDAVVAADGASATLYRRDDRWCGDLVLESEHPDAPELDGALDRWVNAVGSDVATHSTLPAGVGATELPDRTSDGAPVIHYSIAPGAAVLTSCDGVSRVPSGGVVVPMVQLALQSNVIARALREGYDPLDAECAGRAALDDEEMRRIIEEAFRAQRSVSDADKTAAFARGLATCGLAPAPDGARQ